MAVTAAYLAVVVVLVRWLPGRLVNRHEPYPTRPPLPEPPSNVEVIDLQKRLGGDR